MSNSRCGWGRATAIGGARAGAARGDLTLTAHDVGLLLRRFRDRHDLRPRGGIGRQHDASVVFCHQAINPGKEHQQRAAEKLGARWHELDTGHFPMLSMPDELTKIIVEGWSAGRN